MYLCSTRRARKKDRLWSLISALNCLSSSSSSSYKASLSLSLSSFIFNFINSRSFSSSFSFSFFLSSFSFSSISWPSFLSFLSSVKFSSTLTAAESAVFPSFSVVGGDDSIPIFSNTAACHACCGDLASYTRTTCSLLISHATVTLNRGTIFLCVCVLLWLLLCVLLCLVSSGRASISHLISTTLSSSESCSCLTHLNPIGKIWPEKKKKKSNCF